MPGYENVDEAGPGIAVRRMMAGRLDAENGCGDAERLTVGSVVAALGEELAENGEHLQKLCTMLQIGPRATAILAGAKSPERPNLVVELRDRISCLRDEVVTQREAVRAIGEVVAQLR